jgi:hypothetical protein
MKESISVINGNGMKIVSVIDEAKSMKAALNESEERK